MVLDALAGVDAGCEARAVQALQSVSLDGLQFDQVFLNQADDHAQLLQLPQRARPARHPCGHPLHGLHLAADGRPFLCNCQKHILQLIVQNYSAIIILVRRHPIPLFLGLAGEDGFGAIIIMYNKSEQEGDYLESLFIKPFCERYCDDTAPRRHPTSNDEHQKRQPKKQVCSIYNPIPDEQTAIVTKMSANHRRLAEKGTEAASNLTPYLSRKSQEKGLAREIKRQVVEKGKQVPLSLESSQQNWLVIREMHSKISEMRAQQGRQGVPEERRNSLRSQAEAGSGREDAKNIKTMMSYYKNKRLIKHMPKLADSISLSNSEIQESINLRVENASAVRTEASCERRAPSTKRKVYIREKGVRTEQSCPFTEQLKHKLIRIMSTASSVSSFQLKDFLRSSKIDMCTKQLRPRTAVRLKRAEHTSNSKVRMARQVRENEVSAWESGFQRPDGDSLLLV